MKCYSCKEEFDVLHHKENSIEINQLYADNCRVFIIMRVLVCKKCSERRDPADMTNWFKPYKR